MTGKKFQRYFIQALPFGIIWLVFAMVYSLLEYGILGTSEYYPSTHNAYSFKDSILYASLGSFVMGMVHGWIEEVWLRNLFNKRALWLKVLVKSIFYLIFIILFLAGLTLISNSLILKTSITDPEVLKSLKEFATAFSFWSVVIYITLILNIALLFGEVREYFGADTFFSFIRGKYHQPNLEIRIFMFLDMKGSTTIAERLGHKKYFELIKKYYSDMTEPILESSGNIYQYVGDEIVVSWLKEKGLKDNNCIDCFLRISEQITKHESSYREEFGLVPQFKAGYHIGEVTSGEIGIIKKDIIYTGDVLNTTARIQAECNTYDAQVLISEDLFQSLQNKDETHFTEIGAIQLRGKTGITKLYKLVV